VVSSVWPPNAGAGAKITNCCSGYGYYLARTWMKFIRKNNCCWWNFCNLFQFFNTIIYYVKKCINPYKNVMLIIQKGNFQGNLKAAIFDSAEPEPKKNSFASTTLVGRIRLFHGQIQCCLSIPNPGFPIQDQTTAKIQKILANRLRTLVLLSALGIRNVCPESRIRLFPIPDPGSLSKDLSILTQKIVF
jgi:hypothetical protein